MRLNLLLSALVVSACADGGPPSPIDEPPAAPVVAPAHGHAATPPGPPLEDPGPIDAALAKAKAAGKPVILEFSTSWCEPCKLFAAKVLPKPEVQAALAGVAFIQYDAEHGSGVEAAARYHISSFPSFLVVDDKGAVLATTSGINPEDTHWFLDFVRKADLAKPESYVLDALKAHPGDAQVALGAGRWYAAHDRVAEALPHFDSAAAADPKDAAHAGADAMWEAGELRRGLAARAAAAKDLIAYATAYPASSHAIDAVATAIFAAPPAADERHKLWQGVIAAHAGSASDLNGLIYKALATGDLDDALDAANKQVALVKDDANSLDSLAEVQHYRHDKAAALATEDRALALPSAGKLHDDLVANRARFAADGDAPNPGVVDGQHRAEAMWKHAGAIDVDGSSSDGGSPPASPGEGDAMAKAEAYMATRQQALDMIAKACAPQAAGVTSLAVKLDPDDGSAPPKVTIDDPAATPALRDCVTKFLGTAELPKPPEHMTIHAPTMMHF